MVTITSPFLILRRIGGIACLLFLPCVLFLAWKRCAMVRIGAPCVLIHQAARNVADGFALATTRKKTA